jgi:hypothetical protein
MHMLPSYYTTTSTRKRKSKKKTKSLIAAEIEHEKFLKKMRGHSSGGRAAALQAAGPEFESPCLHQSSKIESHTSKQLYDPSMAKKEANVYSGGRKLLGIATLHKSNMVPVFDKESAIEIAKMRRG